MRLFPCLVLVLFAVACRPRGEGAFETAKTLHHEIPAEQVKRLELRVPTGNLAFVQGDQTAIVVEGTLRVRGRDRKATDLRAAALDLGITAGKVMMLSLAEPGNDFEYDADLYISLPRSIKPQDFGLWVVLGSGEVKMEIEPPLMTDLQVGSGDVRLTLPKSASAFVQAEINVGEGIFIRGFEKITGEPKRQLTHVEFNGAIGTPLTIVGNRIEARVNTGNITLEAKP